LLEEEEEVRVREVGRRVGCMVEAEDGEAVGIEEIEEIGAKDGEEDGAEEEEEEIGATVGDMVGDFVGAEVVVEAAEQAYEVTPSAVPQVEVPEQVFEVREEQQVLLQP
jgi:hypothetical protein